MIDIKEKLKLLPKQPGCYLMKDKNNHVIYVGKAKVLKNRVTSYFVGAHNLKTTKLVSEICDFDYLVTSSELESLVLEINLIKQYDPKYNIMLTDDKTYPYIVLTNEIHPRVIVTRSVKKNGKVFGPYPNVGSARKTAQLINRLYPFRKCINIGNKECLYYHMKQCLAPCINNTRFDYEEYKKKTIKFLNGDVKEVISQLETNMIEASNNMDYEKAMEYRDLIKDINITTAKQKIEISDRVAKDIVGVYYDEDSISFCVLYMRNGAIVQTYYSNFDLIDEPINHIKTFLLQFYNKEEIRPKEILISDYTDITSLKDLLGIDILTPQIGKKKELVNMANKNAYESIVNKRNLHKNNVLKKVETIEKLGELLNIDTPNTIEAFDNSNLFGEYPVSAMVVYKNGKPSPKDYRKYHVKTVVGSNDYQTMKEVVYRRYLRLKMEDKPFPDLIMMDGGEIQVNACIEVLKELNIDINVVGIKKDNNHKARCLVFKDKEYNIDKNSDIFLLISNISQKVHDFAISFFRSNKVKGMFTSRLDGIKGIGPKKKELLLKHFLSIDNIKNASIEDFNKIGINEALAITIKDHLND